MNTNMSGGKSLNFGEYFSGKDLSILLELSENAKEVIADALSAKENTDRKEKEQKFYAMHSDMTRTANVIPFTKFVELFRGALEENGGNIIDFKKVPEQENRYLIYFNLEKFKSKIFSFDIRKAAHGDFVDLSSFYLPDDITLENKYEICSQLKRILESCFGKIGDTEKSDLNPEEMNETELKKEIIDLLKGKKYSDLKDFLIGNKKFVWPESIPSEDSYDIHFGGLSLNVWNNLNDGSMYFININGNNKDELKELYVLLTEEKKKES